MKLKGNVIVISSDSTCKDIWQCPIYNGTLKSSNARFPDSVQTRNLVHGQKKRPFIDI